jgi:hypothetical protein
VSLVGFRVPGFVGALGVDHSINGPPSLTAHIYGAGGGGEETRLCARSGRSGTAPEAAALDRSAISTVLHDSMFAALAVRTLKRLIFDGGPLRRLPGHPTADRGLAYGRRTRACDGDPDCWYAGKGAARLPCTPAVSCLSCAFAASVAASIPLRSHVNGAAHWLGEMQPRRHSSAQGTRTEGCNDVSGLALVIADMSA